MEKMKVYSQAEVLDITLGKPGTAERDNYEAQVKEYLVGLAIKQAREAQNLTQAELGERIGVQRARISSIEKGVNLRLSTLGRIFKALGIDANIVIDGMKPIPIC